MAYRIRITDKVPAVSLQPALSCPPVLTGPAEGRRVGTVVVGPGDRLPPAGRPTRMVLEMVVHEDGTVSEIRLVRGSGIRELDDLAVREAQQTRYLPAEIDGIPLTVRIRTDGTRLPR